MNWLRNIVAVVCTTTAVIFLAGCESSSGPDSPVAQMDSFDFASPAVKGAIEQYYETIALPLPAGTDLKSLAPVIKVADKATVLPASGVAVDFSGPVDYTVTAQNGMTRVYTAVAGISDRSIRIVGYVNGNIIGLVFGVDPRDYCIVVYIKVFGSWWTKPTFSAPFSIIQPNGVWKVNVTTGGADSSASQIVAYLVPLTSEGEVPSANSLAALPYLGFASDTIFR